MQEPFGDLFDDLPTSRGMGCIRRDLTQRVATVLDAERASQLYLAFMRHEIDAPTFDAGLEDCILERGMTREDIEREFPPQPAVRRKTRDKPPLSFNRKALIATIVWQEWKWIGQRRPKGNIRHFWYTHLMYTLTRVMGDTEYATIDSTFNKVLEQLVTTEGFRYADLNFVSNKNKLCVSFLEDSPYPNIILACEKESYHAYLSRLAHVFHITYISLGGQGSYGVNEDLVDTLIAHHVDVSQAFRIFVISDFDPQGYDIQGGTQTHLASAGIRQVAVERVYLKPEHMTAGIVARYAVPYEWEKRDPAATKSALTLYHRWATETGGLFLRGGTWVPSARNRQGMYDVPPLTDDAGGYELCRVELDNFQEQILSDLLIDALEVVIDGAAYYYEIGKKVWRQTISAGAWEAAKTAIQRAVDEKLRPIKHALSDIRERLSDRWEALTAEEDALIERVKEDCDYQVESIQERIDSIQEQIDALRDEQRGLERQQEAYRVTEDDVLDFLHAVKQTVVPAIPAAEGILEPIDDRLIAYGDEQESLYIDPVRGRFNREPEPAVIQEMIHGSAHANTVFERARAGAQTFTAELSFREQLNITSAAGDDLEVQQEAMTVEVPDLPDTLTTAIDTQLQQAEDLLDQAERDGELSDVWQALRFRLVRHYIDNDVGWNPWDNWNDGGWRR